MNNTHQIQLPNGIRIVLHSFESSISHACLLVQTGSRDEPEHQYGLAHFIEHLLFKQTERRTTHQILNRLESVGADLNAYTTKEYTCLHASFLTPFLNRALDLFEDLCFHSVFPENELVKEKGVILDEMASYLDSPEEAVIDDFEDLVFKNHALGHNILGLEEDLKGMEKQHIQLFMQQHYRPDQLVIGISGQYTIKQVQKLVDKLFGHLTSYTQVSKRAVPGSAIPEQVEMAKSINQVHQVIGSRACSIHDPDKTAMLLLSNYLGGMGMSSKLNMVVREKHGIAYTIESNFSPYSDTGMFYIYFGTDIEKADKANKLVERELRKLKEQRLSPTQLHQAKQKFKGQIALGEEHRMSLVIALSKNVLDYGRILPLKEVFEHIDQVSSSQIQELSQQLFDPSVLYRLAFVPEEED